MNNNADQSMLHSISSRWPNLIKHYTLNIIQNKLYSAPPISRQSIAPHYWNKANKPTRKIPSFSIIATIRRFILLALILVQTFFATTYLASLLPYQGFDELRILQDWQINPTLAMQNALPYLLQFVILSLFAVLFAWISTGFWTALMGIRVILFKHERYTIDIPSDKVTSIDPEHRTALVMPICNEDVARVFAGLKATWQSLKQSGQLSLCDFYILSDTNSADKYANELKLWADLVDELGDAPSIFYRHRERRVKRKSGNIDDFCRRFGNKYQYMIILDADSVMTGECITNMIAMMEQSPNVGIIQAPPKTIRMRTLYGRIQQFANQTYSDIFCSGVHYWQLREAQYWGHNAIIRLKPFIENCILTPFHKRRKSVHIMSHDLVEAALMKQAGWHVMIAYNLEGSYEEVPANIIEDLKRDNRWCMGNLINLNVIFKPGIRFIHRIMFATSAMAYLSSLLWLIFLLCSTLLLLVFNNYQPQYFLHPNQLYPIWPRWNETLAMQLLLATFTLLLIPKIIAGLIVLVKQGPKSVGGIFAFMLSIILEILFSMILAPVKMFFHSKFVIKALFGSKVQWRSPARSDDALTWRETFYSCWPLMLLGIVWLYAVIKLDPQFTTWFIAILIPLIISPLVIKLSSLSSIGLALKRWNIFLTKEETSPNAAITDTDRNLDEMSQRIIHDAFKQVIEQEDLNHLVCALSTRRHLNNAKQKQYREAFFQRISNQQLSDIDEPSKLQIMADPIVLLKLHHDKIGHKS
ncbi:glucans biosynthesis glucosyltransferase MdoH [Orbus wheelerorum]|uniref:glucans biosynthesis glucosyltransferase MdoH n=1 Tax=Orbus wheelerorum TaxID=3074111 RepID=UPI00370DABCC